ncbi:MAG: sigma-54 dependent transcriptional regulator, partial [Planctomycetota bacterium]
EISRIHSANNNNEVVQRKRNELVGTSLLMQEVYKQIALTTTTDSAVLISGESGTGKELVARSVHQYGPRAGGPFIAVNIAALNPALIESELFGHVKGAFTGADADRVGLIQQADGGTLFLDEVAEIPLSIQVKLLRVLDQSEVTPVGTNAPQTVNFRLISASHQDLLAQVNHGEFRHDLLYRLRAMEIQLPALRERLNDIPELVRYFLELNCEECFSVSDEFTHVLTQRSWPGNVRELENVVLKAAAIARGQVLLAEHIDEQEPAILNTHKVKLELEIQELVRQWTKQQWDDPAGETLYERLINVIEPAILSSAFELSGKQYSSAGRRLGIHRTTLKKKLDIFEGMHPEDE